MHYGKYHSDASDDGDEEETYEQVRGRDYCLSVAHPAPRTLPSLPAWTLPLPHSAAPLQALAAPRPANALTFPVRVGALRRGHHVVLRDRPAKVVNISFSRCGCRRSPWAHVIWLDIFTGKCLQEVTSATGCLIVPVLVRAEYALVHRHRAPGALAPRAGQHAQGRRHPAGLAAALQAVFDAGKEVRVQTLSALGEEGVVSFVEVGEGEGEEE
ncbi:hypothetical protein B0H17DRAFT_1209268 [Mycena rosella]|uniref:Translation initiation factor 5A-like N-terminal domain-containing protein n=1 Tax=Mycena rosella TaxID=1033263 RepID=A0AAD7CYV7_MYCRO|nr:hypothetical protein B0H17DRAFT_1209268 [Mycena rosella]